ncbi:MAG TPA: hypothetical protein DEO83_02940, partial [Lachnospiraceae bacterium]|nr:hypothetical protein [Lachnospiraceae bacterium]
MQSSYERTYETEEKIMIREVKVENGTVRGV